MDSGVVHSHMHDEYGQHGGDGHHHDKNSVLKKVKAKAKKIKDTITKHDHGHDHDHVHDDHDSYEEDDEDEKMVQDPEVHGAPIYESAAVKSAIPGQVENSGHTGFNVGGTTVAGEEHHHEPRIVVVSSSAESNLNRGTESAGKFVGDDKTRQSEVNLDKQIGLDEDPRAPGSRAEACNPDNYQSKVTDTTGAGIRELDTAPVEDSLERMNVLDEPKPNTVLPIGSGIQYPSAESHGQFSLEPTPEPTNATIFPEYPQATRKTSDTMVEPEEHPRCETTEKPSIQSSYTGKPEYPQGTTKKFDVTSHHETLEKPSTQSSYTDKVSSATSAVADKAISAKNVVASKLGYGGKDDRENKENTMKHEDHKISDEKPSNQSSYTEKLSSATSAIAGKAISAKNILTSKLGYGGKVDTDNKETTTHVDHETRDASTKPESTLDYGKKIATAVTEKLSPVYGAVAGAGSAVISKLPGTGTAASTGSGNETESVAPRQQDKGISVKDYLAEKLRPGDEDRALSEVISDAYRKPEKAEQKRPLGKVTESEEVKRYLGTEKNEKESGESYVDSPGKGVVDKLKGTVGSWFGKTEETPSSQEERRLQ